MRSSGGHDHRAVDYKRPQSKIPSTGTPTCETREPEFEVSLISSAVPDGITSAAAGLAANKAIANTSVELNEKVRRRHRLLACGPRVCRGLKPFRIYVDKDAIRTNPISLL